jgi:hypothetical protein
LSQYYRQVRQDERPIRYFAQDESRFGLKTILGRLITACGVKPIGQWQWLFKAFWLYGAVEPATGESFFWQFSHVDTPGIIHSRSKNILSMSWARNRSALVRES